MLILSMDDVANTEVIVEHPQVEPQEIPQPEIVPTPPEKKSKLNLWLSIVSVLLLTFILGTYYFIIQSKPKTSQPEEILVTEEVEQEDFTNYSFDVGFQISLPKNGITDLLKTTIIIY